MKSVALHNLGCKVNSYEMDVMQQMLQEKGYKYISMSGSGATIFVLGSKKNLKDLYKDLKKEYEDYKIYLTKII